MLTVPINLGSTAQGLAQCAGMLELHHDSLVVKIQSREVVLDVFRSPVRSVTIPFGTVERISLRRGLFGCRLELRLKDMNMLAKIPNAKDGIARFKIGRRHRKDAEEIRSICQLAIADARLRSLDDLLTGD